MVGHVLGKFSTDEQNELENTLATAAEAVQLALSKGCVSYDFLAGSERYKSSLALDKQDSNKIAWIRIQRPRWHFRLERFLKNKLRKKLNKSH